MSSVSRLAVCLLIVGIGCSAEPNEEPDEDPATQAAIDDLQLIIDGTVAYFEAEHPPGDGAPADTPLHRCPHPTGATSVGESGITPPIDMNCNDGPDQKCVPTANGGGVGHYDQALWQHNVVWMGVGFEKSTAHAFHYNLVVSNATAGYGACTFTARAFADLDDDQVFSTYERRGSANEQGVDLDPMLHVVNEGE